MTTPALPPLLDPNDYAKFIGLDQDWFLGVAGQVIRDYCNWHIWPVISEQNILCPVSPNGKIILNSLHVVSVESITYQEVSLDPTDYTVFQAGWIQWNPFYVVNVASIAPEYVWPANVDWMQVSFTHGYDTVPTPVEEVGFEITMRAMEKPAGIAKELVVGPYRASFGEFGMTLSEEQKCKLAPYALQGIL